MSRGLVRGAVVVTLAAALAAGLAACGSGGAGGGADKIGRGSLTEMRHLLGVLREPGSAPDSAPL
ncbi:hypothetical protein AB0392_28360, partial [Nonomuraea angiospora]